MVSLLKTSLVEYRCSCDVWRPPSQLYFCRKCDRLKCALCAHEELDIVFCPNCMEGTNEQRKWRCDNCACCPLCDNTLIVRGLSNGLCYALCTSCFWTTRDAGLADLPLPAESAAAATAVAPAWPDHQHADAARLEAVMLWMRDFVASAKTERERRQQRSKRFSNLGTLSNDRYGLSNAYSKRRKALSSLSSAARTAGGMVATRAEEFISPTADVPELDPSVFTAIVTVDNAPPTLDQLLRQPLRGADAPALPSKRRLISRRFLRCNEHDTLLYRCELNCYAVKPKIACFAFEIVPEIRISRPVQLVGGQPFSIFLVVSNNSLTTVSVTLRSVAPLPGDERCVDCFDFVSTFTIPNRDNVADIDEFFQTPAPASADFESGAVVMIKRHRYGIRVDCKPLAAAAVDLDGEAAPYVSFLLTYSCPDETPNKRLDLNVRLVLDRAARAVEY